MFVCTVRPLSTELCECVVYHGPLIVHMRPGLPLNMHCRPDYVAISTSTKDSKLRHTYGEVYSQAAHRSIGGLLERRSVNTIGNVAYTSEIICIRILSPEIVCGLERPCRCSTQNNSMAPRNSVVWHNVVAKSKVHVAACDKLALQFLPFIPGDTIHLNRATQSVSSCSWQTCASVADF